MRKRQIFSAFCAPPAARTSPKMTMSAVEVKIAQTRGSQQQRELSRVSERTSSAQNVVEQNRQRLIDHDVCASFQRRIPKSKS